MVSFPILGLIANFFKANAFSTLFKSCFVKYLKEMDYSTSKIGFTKTLYHDSGFLNEEDLSVPFPLRHTVGQILSFVYTVSQRITKIM